MLTSQNRDSRLHRARRAVQFAYALIAAGLVLPVIMLRIPTVLGDAIYAWSSAILPLFPLWWAWRVIRDGDAETAASWKWILVGTLGLYAYEMWWFVGWAAGKNFAWDPEDVVSLLFAPMLLIGSLRGRLKVIDRADGWRTAIDTTVVFIALTTLLATLFAAGGALHVLTRPSDLLKVLDPVTGLLTLGGLAVLWVRRDYTDVPAWAMWLGWSLLIGMIGDVYYAMPRSVGHPSPWFVRMAWYGSWGTHAYAAALAMRPRLRVPIARVQHSRLPYLMVTAAYIALVLAVTGDNHELMKLVTLCVGIVTILVLARQYIAARELEVLYEERASLHAEGKLAALVRHGTDLLSIIDPDGTLRFASPSHEITMGHSAEWLVGKNLFDGIHRDDLPKVQTAFASLVKGEQGAFAVTFRVRHADKSWRWIDGFATDLRDEPSIGAIVLNGRDVTERQAMEARLLDQVLRDPLTGLGNRRLFRDRVEHALARHQRGANLMAVLFLDLDHFKIVNDTLGHAAGDALLTTVAGRITAVLRTSDTIARLGGDEFAVLLEDMLEPSDAEAAALRIQQALERPIVIDDREVYARASIGIAHAHETHDVDDLLADADAAMYGAKQAGRGRIQGFSSAMRATARERMEIESELRHAIAREELYLVYQPVLDLHSGKITGVEALMRWDHPTKGPISPGRFISVAEESDLIVEIGRTALRQAARDAVWLRGTSPAAATLQVAVNLSPRHLLLPEVVTDIQQAIHDAHCDPQALVVEITETVLAANESIIAERLKVLRELGVQIALDDFGTGYSSLAYLRRFPIDILKVDRSFLADHDADITADGVTRAIVSIGHSLGLRTVAEGVETERQLDQLVRLGCGYAQGFVIARPGDRQAVAALLRAWDVEGMRARLGAGSMAA
ncbi:MAG: EAL domain-containing protein [Gemmatimonadaceae bacterium]|nr:EAL domain-containing protein [Gemmatimonadaceae bacterium]